MRFSVLSLGLPPETSTHRLNGHVCSRTFLFLPIIIFSSGYKPTPTDAFFFPLHSRPEGITGGTILPAASLLPIDLHEDFVIGFSNTAKGGSSRSRVPPTFSTGLNPALPFLESVLKARHTCVLLLYDLSGSYLLGGQNQWERRLCPPV